MHITCAFTTGPFAKYWHQRSITPPQTGRLGRVVCLEDVLLELLHVLLDVCLLETLSPAMALQVYITRPRRAAMHRYRKFVMNALTRADP